MQEAFIAFGSPEYFLYLALLLVGRAADFLSTWIATPNLVLEANPIARRLGWKWGGVVNGVVCLLFACWPLPAIVIITTSVLVAARNFQSAWLMRSLGEARYRTWIVERLAESSRLVFLVCMLAQSLLVASVGVVLMLFSRDGLVPFAVGTGMVAYAFAVTIFTVLSVRRVWRANGFNGLRRA
jgi:hypothetical protein